MGLGQVLDVRLRLRKLGFGIFRFCFWCFFPFPTAGTGV